ncbi:hypothetical protein IEE91_09015 [Kocuria sp. cx-455]|uniref:hypothetical protein n=1 Tax=unclassified Candidatus Sulfotelmatobacter TaxID=2635724 RepID=UPI001685E9F2|nr:MULTISPECIES: hypothetical protein [unclassified Candidatus Sulfotelmatobacter]MBD2762634.1 hypothetical protein [Kocuria sp. cx-116]MBD2765320.1 hypothetical protein [Kocuria sp. cx-455]
MGSTTTPTFSSRRPFVVRHGARSVTAVAVAALALTACSAGGGGGGDEPDPQASYSQDQVVSALNSVEVEGQTLSAEPMDGENAGSQMEDLEQVIDQATIEPAQCKDLVKEAMDTSSGHVEDIVVATPSEGQYAVTALPMGSSDEAAEHARTANQQNEDCREFTMELMGNKIEASIEPRDLDLDKATEATLMNMTMDMDGQSNTMTQASAVVGNTFVVVSGQGGSSGAASPSAAAPDIESILQESVTKISEQ